MRSPLATMLCLAVALACSSLMADVAMEQTVTKTQDTLFGVAYGNGLFVAVGKAGQILTSKDGANWTARKSGVDYTISGVAFGKGQFVAVTYENPVLVSKDGVVWESVKVPGKMTRDRIIYANNQFVSAGSLGNIQTSPDGRTWTAQKVPTVLNLCGLAYTGKQYLVAGFRGNRQGEVLCSTDGKKWKSLWFHDAGEVTKLSDAYEWNNPSRDEIELYSVAYGNGVAVAGGTGGKALYSKDMKNWSRTRLRGNGALGALTFADGRFIGGSGGSFYTSTNGKDWTPTPSDKMCDVWGIVYAQGCYVAVGTSSDFTSGAILRLTSR